MSFRSSFESPDKIFRPVQIIHHKYPRTEIEIEKYLDESENLGRGGFVITMGSTDNLPEKYMSDDEKEWSELKKFADKCFDRGFKLWIYDENGYPSGVAGHLVYDYDNDYHVKGLSCQFYEADENDGCLNLVLNEKCRAFAYKMLAGGFLSAKDRVELSIKDNIVHWNLPEGKWFIAAFMIKRLDFITLKGSVYVDLLRRDVVGTFINVTHEKYLKHLGKERLSQFEAIFTDEPTLPTHGCSHTFNELWPVAAWSDGLSEAFLKKYGYDISEHFDCLFYNTDTDYKKVRRDYYSLLAETYAKNYFLQIYDWCEKYNLEATGHLYGEETLSMQIGLNADLFGLLRYMQMPGVDRLYATSPKDIIPEKTASSAAHLYNRKRTMSESSLHFEGAFWKSKCEFSDIINSGTYQYVLGINNISSYYNMNQSQQGAQRNIFSFSDWQKYHTYMGRLSNFISEGIHRAPALVLIPMTGAWERYRPTGYKYWVVGPSHVAPYQNEEMKALEKLYGDTLYSLMENKYDFDLIDEEGLSEFTSRDGAISSKYEDFKFLIIFDTGYISPETKEKLSNLINCGAVLYIVRLEDTFSDNANELINHGGKVIAVSADALISKILKFFSKVFDIKENDKDIFLRHSTVQNTERCLIHNMASADKTVHVLIPPCKKVTVYNPLTGEIEEMAASKTTIVLNLPQRQGILLECE